MRYLCRYYIQFEAKCLVKGMAEVYSNQDYTGDIGRRVLISRLAVQLIVFLASSWFIVMLVLGEYGAAIIAGAVAINYAVCWWLFSLEYSHFARNFWLFSATVTTVFGQIFAQPLAEVDLLFLPILSMPFLVFSWRTERISVLIYVAIPVIAWLSTVYFGLIGASDWLFGIENLSLNMDMKIINSFLKVTVAVLLVAELSYFTKLSAMAEHDLSVATRRAQDAARTQGDFLANMSHEIRTPMNGLIGMIEVLETMEPTQEQVRVIGTIRNSAFSLLRIIDDILDARKIEAGKLEIEQTRTEVRPVIEGVAVTLQSMADDMGVRIRMSIDPKLPDWILVDSGRLRQIMLNILSNAIKYSSRDLKGHDTEVYFHVESVGGDTLRMVVEDKGIGMSDAVKQKLFQPFTQGEASTTRRVGGTGLGLVITKSLVERMGGEITSHSVEGEGTTFTINMPMIATDGPRSLPRINGAKIVWLIDRKLPPPRWFEHFFALNDASFKFASVEQDLSNFDMVIEPNSIFMIAAESNRILESWRDILSKREPSAKFIFLSSHRSDRLGSLDDKTYRVQVFPMLVSELHQAIAFLMGRVSVDRGNKTAPKTELPSEKKKEARSKFSLLLVEDNEINRTVLLKQLEILGYPADVAKNGREGLEKWENGSFDLILSDCHMPLMDGYEMAGAIRQIEEASSRSRTPIVAITANALKGEADKCYAAGMDDYLAKPVEIKALEAKLTKTLGS